MSNIETIYRVIAICLCCAGISVKISRQIKLSRTDPKLEKLHVVLVDVVISLKAQLSLNMMLNL